MSDHFRAFSFVDRIHEDETGRQSRGSYQIPDGVRSFPLSLVSESIGQLAAFSSMAAVNFAFRPVAGIAGRVEFPGTVKPGDTLELEAVLSQADDTAVAYDGVAKVNGEPVVILADCLGPMVPLDALLRGEGATPGAFAGVPDFSVRKTGGIPGETSEGNFPIPEEAPFFRDHFPRNPVFPGTLLMNLHLGFAKELVSELVGADTVWIVSSITDVKLRSFMPPGEVLDLKASVEEHDGPSVRVVVETRRGKRLTSSARILLSRTL